MFVLLRFKRVVKWFYCLQDRGPLPPSWWESDVCIQLAEHQHLDRCHGCDEGFLGRGRHDGGGCFHLVDAMATCLSLIQLKYTLKQQTCSTQFYNIYKQTAPNVDCPTLEFHLLVVTSGQKVFDMCGQSPAVVTQDNKLNLCKCKPHCIFLWM